MTHLKLLYVQRYRDKKGKWRHYFRRKGQPKIKLPGEPWSRDFMAAYQAALASEPPMPPPIERHAPRTFGRLVTDYYRSAEFLNLKPNSQRVYRLILDPLAQKHAHRLVADMRPTDARKIVEGVAWRISRGQCCGAC
jgi:hypothetical protein